MEQDSNRLFTCIPCRLTKTTERCPSHVPQLNREPDCRFKNQPAMVTNNGMAVEHAKWLFEFELRRSQHGLPIPCGYFPRSCVDDFAILTKQYGSARHRPCKLSVLVCSTMLTTFRLRSSSMLLAPSQMSSPFSHQTLIHSNWVPETTYTIL